VRGYGALDFLGNGNRTKVLAWVEVVFAGLVDDAKPKVGIALDWREQAVDLADLKRKSVAAAVNADNVPRGL